MGTGPHGELHDEESARTGVDRVIALLNPGNGRGEVLSRLDPLREKSSSFKQSNESSSSPAYSQPPLLFCQPCRLHPILRTQFLHRGRKMIADRPL